MATSKRRKRYLQTLFWGFAAIWVLLAVKPVYRDDWFLENLLVFAAVPYTLYLRRRVSRRVRVVFVFACSIITLLSVLYELMEWAAAVVVAPEAGTAFLGTQGDEWDAQKDLLLNLSGAIASAVFLPFLVRKKT